MPGHLRISRLGKFGGWGNQLFQYCAGKSLAEARGSTLEIPDNWLGRAVFKIDDPPCSDRELPTPGCDPLPHEIPQDADLWGYFQCPEWLKQYSRADARRWLQWRKPLVPLAVKCLAHRRFYRGFEHVYAVVSKESYKRCRERWGLPGFVYLEDPDHRDPGCTVFDFRSLCSVEYLMRANSTYSLWAGVLSLYENECKIYSPVVGSLVGPVDVEFSAGNHWPIVDVEKNAPGNIGRAPKAFLWKGDRP